MGVTTEPTPVYILADQLVIDRPITPLVSHIELSLPLLFALKCRWWGSGAAGCPSSNHKFKMSWHNILLQPMHRSASHSTTTEGPECLEHFSMRYVA